MKKYFNLRIYFNDNLVHCKLGDYNLWRLC